MPINQPEAPCSYGRKKFASAPSPRRATTACSLASNTASRSCRRKWAWLTTSRFCRFSRCDLQAEPPALSQLACDFAVSGWELHPAKKILKAGIGSDAVGENLSFKTKEVVGMFPVRPLQ